MHRLITILLAVLLLGACMEEEKFDTRAGDRLAFSVDTLKFDTVISGMGTPTAFFMVYNRSDHGVSIADVSFENGESKGYRVNVDGMYINEGLSQSIDCPKKDSLRVFVELTPEVRDSDDPVELTATLLFTLSNGVQQPVVLTAWSQDVVVMRGFHVTRNMTFSSRRPYLVYDSLTVDEGVTMTIAAGTLFYFHSDAGLRVDGTLKAEGSMTDPVVMRGDRTDMMFENQPYDRVSNQWQGVHFTGKSYGNRLNWCDIHSGKHGVVCDSSDVTRLKLVVENSVIHNMGGHCLSAFSSKIMVGNSQISNAAKCCVKLYGGDAEFIHCTLAQFYPFDGMRGPALEYGNSYGDVACPLVRAHFINCIVTGYSDDEVFGLQWKDHPEVDFNYGFYNCLLDTDEVLEDASIVQCQWDRSGNPVKREGNFPKFNLDALLFDFSLVEKSLAVGAADATVAVSHYPRDRRGVVRMSDGQADAGCYEFVMPVI